MSGILGNLRAFANGNLSESTLRENVADENGTSYDYENDEEFLRECTEAALPLMTQMMIFDEAVSGIDFDELDEDTRNAFYKVSDYMVGQGLISEAATPSLSNKKINIVRLNKQAQIHRLTSIITLKMARKANSKNYTKYKMGQKIKKTNMEEMRKKYGAKAERLSKKLYAKLQKSHKATAVTKEVAEKHVNKK